MIGRRDVIALGMGALASAVVWPLWSDRQSAPKIRQRPLRFAVDPFPDTERVVTPSLQSLIRRRLRLRDEMGVPTLLHWLRIFGIQESAEFQSGETRRLLSLLTDAREIERRFDQPGVIVKTREGVRFLSRGFGRKLNPDSRPSHPYQELAIFGELGLPSSAPIVAAEGRFTIADLVRDCLGNLQIREASRQEPEWATQALAHYVVSDRAWRNRWDEELTLDRWTEFLIERELTGYSCGGTHLLHTLAVILQADAQQRILDAKVARHVRDVCRRFSRTIESTQHADGAWRADWWKEQTVAEYSAMEVHLTGHLLEAQLYLPRDLRISDACAGRALQFLSRTFQLSDDKTVFEEFCPYSHAGRVLLYCAAPAESGPSV